LITKGTYPPGHPYSWTTIGSLEDLTPTFGKWPEQERDDFSKAWWDTGTYEGKKYIAPLLLFGDLMLYRTMGEEAEIADIFRKKYGMRAGSVTGAGNFIPPYTPPDENGQTENATPFWMVGATGVEVEVDTETGRVRVTRLVNVADVGTPINPAIVETQLSGAAVMQYGFTMTERNVGSLPAMLDLVDREGIDKFYRNRLRSMLAVDDLIGRIVNSLRYSRKFSNTYIVFTSDNGAALGTHRRIQGKWSSYEEDMKVPLIVRGPGVPGGVERRHMVLNNDLAPTFAKLGRVSAPSFGDGRSFAPLLHRGPPSPSNWRTAFLSGSAHKSPQRAYKAVRTTNSLWVEYANGERELYNLRRDPYELRNSHQTASADRKQRLSSKLDRLRDCSRQGCRNAEGF
jgi:hypothetical protein